MFTVYPTFELPEVDGKRGSVFNGESGSDYSGSSVVNAGDLNGNGFTDFAISAPNTANGGKVYVIFGSIAGFNPTVDLSTLNGNNGFTILAESSTDQLGFSLAGGVDVNGDGLADLVIGAPSASSNAGKVYLIYGNIGFNATLSLAALGTKGFVIYGASGQTGSSLGVARDFNGDGFGDLIIGAPSASPNGLINSGLGAVVFGTNKTVSAVNISALNGTNGFIIPGIFYQGQSGLVASGDIDGNGLSDIVIGTLYASPNGKNNAGFVSVIFGAKKSFSKSLNVSLLNGTDGFSIEGISMNDNLGSSISTCDINDDGRDDLLMGASGASPGGKISAGAAFVFFGKSSFNAKEDLLQLNGTNGYRINGQLAGDSLGVSISGGRINGDRFPDVIIGAPFASSKLPQEGSTFIVFGTNATVNAVLELPGSNDKVLRIDGGLANINSGGSVAAADVRGDGLSGVIIGAKMASPGNTVNGGSTYVVYGDDMQLINNQLNISAGGSHILTLSDLNVSVPFNPGYTQYTVTGIQNGQFEYITQPGIAITGFSAQDVMDGLVKFVHYDIKLPPSYSIAAIHTLAAIMSDPANITFICQSQKLVNNSVRINQGQTVPLDSTMLAAVDPSNATHNSQIVHTTSGCSGGFFTPPTGFSQDQVNKKSVYFTPDGSTDAPACNVSISWGGLTVGPMSLAVDFATTPVLEKNHFNFCQGQTTLVTADMLNATLPGADADTLVFSIQNPQYGYFERTSAPGVKILQFTLAEIKSGVIQFVQDGSANSPGFQFTVSSPRVTTPSNLGGVYFTAAPILTKNTLTVAQGREVILNNNNLQAINFDDPSEDLKFTVDNVEGGNFFKVNGTQNITDFYQSEVAANEIAFQPDGSDAPSYTVSVGNLCSQTRPSAADINFNSAPVLTNNWMIFVPTNSQPILVGSPNAALSATDKETPIENLRFNVTVTEGGCFESLAFRGQCIPVFPQRSVLDGTTLFVPDGSGRLPVYEVGVTDGQLWDGSAALVTLDKMAPAVTSNTPSNPYLTSLYVFLGVTLPLGLVFWGFKRWGDACCDNKLETQVKNLPQETRDAEWADKVLLPMMKLVLNRAIKNPRGWCGYAPVVVQRYATATTKLIAQLEANNVEVDFSKIENNTKRNALQNVIVEKIQQYATIDKSPNSCCNLFNKFLCLPNRPSFTPEALNHSADAIASAVGRACKEDVEVELVQPNSKEKLGVELESDYGTRLARIEKQLGITVVEDEEQISEFKKPVSFSSASNASIGAPNSQAIQTGKVSGFTTVKQRLSSST